MDFTTKDGITTSSATHYKGKWDKPLICPRCNYGTDAPITGCSVVAFGTGRQFMVVAMKCTHCCDIFVALYEITSSSSGTYAASFLRCHPTGSGDPLPPSLADLSPRFANLHRQAQVAEENDLLDAAAMSYRLALEVLVKDFAIKELGEDSDSVSSTSLANAIGKYLMQDSLVKTADVVRILGNDYAHYDHKYPQHDFSLLKHYFRIFISLVATQLDIRHPPVSRNANRPSPDQTQP